ncbi:MAG: hypothetical protein VX589_06450 [Myxococcota bacterium]|nr:hypothetical protein [Myxococcota bacterium]
MTVGDARLPVTDVHLELGVVEWAFDGDWPFQSFSDGGRVVPWLGSAADGHWDDRRDEWSVKASVS